MQLKLLNVTLLAAGLAGCAGGTMPPESRASKDASLPPGQGAFGGGLTWEMRRKTDEQQPAKPPAAAASAAEQEEFKKWQESAGNTERQEFEEWRAWQEWKRKNPK